MRLNFKFIAGIVVAIILGFLAGFYVGENRGLEIGLTQGRGESQTKIDQLNKALDFFVPPVPAEIFSVSGEIKSIDNNVISLEIASLAERALPNAEQKKEMRIITVVQTTKLVKLNLFLAPEIDPKTNLPVLPKPESIKLSDLKAGDRITVSAKENIKTKTEFEAQEIQLQILP